MDRFNLISYVRDQKWAIRPEVLGQIVEVIRAHESGERLTDVEIRERIASGDEEKRELQAEHGRVASAAKAQGIAVIPVFGIIAQHAHMVNDISGPRGTSTEALSAQIQAAVTDPNVAAIVLNIHSPGGGVFGVPELAAEIRSLRKQKRITAVANSAAASAAYWIASAASDVSVTPGGQVGSIGVFAVHEDISRALDSEGIGVTLVSAGKFKTAGNPFEPLSKEAMSILQGEVDHYYDLFTSAVAKGRGVGVSEVRNGFGEGKMLVASEAVTEKMADRVETLQGAVDRVAKEVSRGPQASGQAVAVVAGEGTTTLDVAKDENGNDISEAAEEVDAAIEGREATVPTEASPGSPPPGADATKRDPKDSPPNCPACDQCGKPATSNAQDFRAYHKSGDGYWVSQRVGVVKHGCDEHPVESVEHPAAIRESGKDISSLTDESVSSTVKE